MTKTSSHVLYKKGTKKQMAVLELIVSANESINHDWLVSQLLLTNPTTSSIRKNASLIVEIATICYPTISELALLLTCRGQKQEILIDWRAIYVPSTKIKGPFPSKIPFYRYWFKMSQLQWTNINKKWVLAPREKQDQFAKDFTQAKEAFEGYMAWTELDTKILHHLVFASSAEVGSILKLKGTKPFLYNDIEFGVTVNMTNAKGCIYCGIGRTKHIHRLPGENGTHLITFINSEHALLWQVKYSLSFASHYYRTDIVRNKHWDKITSVLSYLNKISIHEIPEKNPEPYEVELNPIGLIIAPSTSQYGEDDGVHYKGDLNDLAKNSWKIPLISYQTKEGKRPRYNRTKLERIQQMVDSAGKYLAIYHASDLMSKSDRMNIGDNNKVYNDNLISTYITWLRVRKTIISPLANNDIRDLVGYIDAPRENMWKYEYLEMDTVEHIFAELGLPYAPAMVRRIRKWCTPVELSTRKITKTYDLEQEQDDDYSDGNTEPFEELEEDGE